MAEASGSKRKPNTKGGGARDRGPDRSATTTFLDRLEYDLEQSGRYASWDTSIESVFIGDDESDCAVRATR